MPTVLGFDQSTKHTGWALLDNSGVIECGQLDADDWHKMVDEITDKIIHAVPDTWDRIDAVAFEGVFLMPAPKDGEKKKSKQNPKTTIQLARLLGACEYVAYEMGYRCITLLATEADKLCHFSYRAGGRKAATARFAERLTDDRAFRDASMEHIADAIVIAEAARATLKREEWEAE
jgi:hypothetical protein